MKLSHKKKILFDLYSNNLKSFIDLTNARVGYEDENNKFVRIEEPALLCPLCKKIFKEKSLQNIFLDSLTLEHIPPESVGGKAKILTCKLCNQNLGKDLDHFIKKQLDSEPFIRGINNSKIHGKFQVNDGASLPAIFQHGDGSFTISPQYHDKIKYPYERSRNELIQKWNGTRFKINFPVGNPKMTSLAILKSAYLEMFCLFGHVFLFNQNSEKIRQQIINNNLSVLPHSSIVEQDFNDNVEGINIIHFPLNKICFFVIMSLRVNNNNYKKKVGVLIPGPDDYGWGTYCSYFDNSQFDAKLIHLSGLNFIREKAAALDFLKIWEDAKTQVI